jgi:single-strand DNA-binding protein
MNESYVTLQGWVGNEVDLREVGETQCASFRVGCTPRWLRNGVWVSGETSWYTVNCWRSMARNVAESIRKGDAVVVHGRVKVDVWERDGQPPSVAWIVDATFVGHDLSKGSSTFVKAPRSQSSDPAETEELKQVIHGYDPVGPRLDGDGEQVDPAA